MICCWLELVCFQSLFNIVGWLTVRSCSYPEDSHLGDAAEPGVTPDKKASC